VGSTGIYEIDLHNQGMINNLRFVDNTLKVNKKILIDIIYDQQEG
jgi:hypothetical protein